MLLRQEHVQPQVKYTYTHTLCTHTHEHTIHTLCTHTHEHTLHTLCTHTHEHTLHTLCTHTHEHTLHHCAHTHQSKLTDSEIWEWPVFTYSVKKAAITNILREECESFVDPRSVQQVWRVPVISYFVLGNQVAQNGSTAEENGLPLTITDHIILYEIWNSKSGTVRVETFAVIKFSVLSTHP